MTTFNMKEWLMTNKTNPQDGILILNEQIQEGYATIVKPSDPKLPIYLDKLKNFDWAYDQSRDSRVIHKGQRDIQELKQLYAELSPSERHDALDAFSDAFLEHFKPEEYPQEANAIKYLTTNSFKGYV